MVGPGARTVGEPPYRAIQQLTDQLEATPPGPAKERIPMRERLADAWGQGKTAWERAIGKMTATKQTLKDTARGVRTPKDMDRRVGELDWSLQQSAAQSLNARKALEKQMPNKAMREAVAIWIDAGGDEGLIGNVLANLPEGTPKNVRAALEVASRLPPESKALAEQVKQFYGIRAQDGMSADVLHNTLEDYFTHVWKKPDNMPEAVKAAFSNGRVDTFFRNAMQRKIPLLLNGILEGKVPELDPAQVLTQYNYSLDRAIASRKFIKEISDMTEADGRPTLSPVGRQNKVGEPGITAEEGTGALLIKPKARWEENGDYHYVDHPALRKWKWAGTDETGRTILYQSDLVVHPDAYERISRMMDRGRLTPSKLTSAALRLSTEVKGFKLGVLSAFHTVHVGSHALFHWTDPVKAGFKPIDWEAPETKFAVEKGHLKLAPNPSELSQFAEGLLSPGLVHKIPLIGAWSKQFSEWNFGTYIPRLKMATFENAYARAKWMQDKMGAFKGLTDEEIAARTGDSVNNAFGELNQLFLGKNGRAPEFQRLLRGIFLAPDFGEARLRFAEKAFTKFGHEERIALATMFGVFYTTARVANLVANGDPEWDPKRAFSVKIGNHWWSMRSVIGDAWRAVNDFGKFLYPRLNPVYTRPIMDLIVGRDVMSGKKLTTFDKLVARPLEQIVPIHLGGLTRDDQKVWESFAGSMGLAAIRDTPEMDMKRMAGKWLADNGHPATAEYLPTDTPTYAKLRQALAIGNERNARKIIAALKQTHEDKKIMDAMERYVNHPFTGSNEHEDEFVGGLSEPNLKLYQRAKEQRQKTLEDFYKIWFSLPKAKE